MRRTDFRRAVARSLASLAIASAVFPISASANPSANIIDLHGDTGENVLFITQSGSENRATVRIDTPESLVQADTWSGGIPVLAGLAPGRISQKGTANDLFFHVTGAGNLFAASQTGFGNRIATAVSGTHNQEAIYQSGNHLTAVVNQTGSRNSVAISQVSW